MQAVVMAGGKGTRIANLNQDIPKPMFQLCGKPVLEYAVGELVAQGITDIILVVGHLGNVIKEYFANFSGKLLSDVIFKNSSSDGGFRTFTWANDEILNLAGKWYTAVTES